MKEFGAHDMYKSNGANSLQTCQKIATLLSIFLHLTAFHYRHYGRIGNEYIALWDGI